MASYPSTRRWESQGSNSLRVQVWRGGSAEMGGRPYWRTGSSRGTPLNGMTEICWELKWSMSWARSTTSWYRVGSQVLPRRSVWATGHDRRRSSQMEKGSVTYPGSSTSKSVSQSETGGASDMELLAWAVDRTEATPPTSLRPFCHAGCSDRLAG